MKTPEQMAREFANDDWGEQEWGAYCGFLAGYQAAQNQFCEALKTLEKHRLAAENAVTNIKNASDWVTIEKEKANENT